MIDASQEVASPGTFAASEDGSHWTFSGALTFDNAAAALEASSQFALPTSGRIDLSGLGVADSAALAVVFALKRRGKAERRELVFEALPPGLASLARVYGVDGML